MADGRNWFHAAGVIWPMLTEAGSSGRTLTYTQVAPAIATNPLSVRLALGPIQTYCMENRLAPLTAVVVGKNSSVPGDGFVAWDVDDLAAALAAVQAQNWTLVGNPFTGFGVADTEDTFAEELVADPGNAADVYRRVHDRGVAQRVFRKALLLAYDERCAFCGLAFPDALEAAHIVPWGSCEPAQRLDVRNGVLLCASHHRLFDRNIMWLQDEFIIAYYDPEGKDGRYRKVDRAFAVALHGSGIRMPKDPTLRPNAAHVRRRIALAAK